MTNTNLIPFDLEAKAGKKVIYRNGEVPDEFYVSKHGILVSFIRESVISHYQNGMVYRTAESDYDLFMAEEEMYVFLGKDDFVSTIYNELERIKGVFDGCDGQIYKLVKV